MKNTKPVERRPKVRDHKSAVLFLSMMFAVTLAAVAASPPNVVIIFADDLGYGDLGCYGHPTIRTPNLDRMAVEGQKWTSFYSAAGLCTASRAALMTGRHAVRSGMISDRAWVLYANAAGGLPDSEVTLARLLQDQGYATGFLGKWHLGHLPRYLPTRRGFDYFYGTPYSNDEKISDKWRHLFAGKRGWETPAFYDSKSEYWDIPLMHNEKILERPVDQTRFTQRYTDRAIEFIEKNKTRPFFLFFAHNMPHVPLFASDGFRGKSLAGPYGDAVEEIDWGVGKILETLRRLELENNTLVVFTSDNGPWRIFREHGGSAGLLRDEKGATWEGGLRVPAVFWWPQHLKPGVVTDIGSTLDLFTTVCKLAGAPIPTDRNIDGLDLTSALLGGKSPRDTMFYYRGTKVYAVRKGPFKAHFSTKPAWGSNLKETKHDPPLLYHLGHDPAERFDIAEKHPGVIQEMRRIVSAHQDTVTPVADQLIKRLPD